MNNQQAPKSDRIKILAGVVVIAFAVALALVIGNRLSNESLAVLAGAACGVGAAIPTSLLVVAVSRRQDAHTRNAMNNQQGTYPPVVVVAPPSVQPQQYVPPHIEPSSSYRSSPPPRQFTVVGDGYDD